MFNSDILEVAIGLIFVYLLFSFIATAAREAVEAWLRQRSALLERGILQLLGEPHSSRNAELSPEEALRRAEEVLVRLYRSAPVFGLFRGHYTGPSEREKGTGTKQGKLPSYIPAGSFADGILHVVESYANAAAGGSPGSIDRLRLAVEGVPNAQVRDMVRSGIRLSGGDPAKLRKHLEDWYAGAMDRVAGQYRRRTQWMILVGSLVMAVALNVNTITIVQTLAQNQTLRAAVMRNAERADAGQGPTSSKLQGQLEELREAGLPIGWDARTMQQTTRIALQGPYLNPQHTRVLPVGSILLALGWVMTALAISLGAPFWFDLLNKFMVVRSTVKPREKSLEERSKDPSPKVSGRDSEGEPELHPPVTAPPTRSPNSSADLEEIAGLDPYERPREEH